MLKTNFNNEYLLELLNIYMCDTIQQFPPRDCKRQPTSLCSESVPRQQPTEPPPVSTASYQTVQTCRQFGHYFFLLKKYSPVVFC